MNSRQSLAIIPARGGSKRFPNKNLSLLKGKPLINHSIELACQNFSTVIFTSDSEELLGLSKQNKFSNLYTSPRPAELASDTSQVIDTVKYYYELRENDGYDTIFLLLPTCPLRTHNDIASCKDILQYENCVVSITDYEFPPSLSLNFNGHYISSTCPSMPWETKNHRSQNHRNCYRPNGAIYGSKWFWFRESGFNFYTNSTKGYYMPRERSIDIDNEIDLKVAELMMDK